MKCQHCRKKAIIKSPRLCEDHFPEYFERKIGKFLDKFKIKNKKILVSISGGKDSVVVSYVLSKLKEKYNLQIEYFFIDLGIPIFSEKSKEISLEVTKKLNNELIIYNLEKEDGFTIMDIKYKPCSYCGMIRRYILNKYAYENNFDYVVLGHNLDDEVFFLFNNMFNKNISQLQRTGPLTLTIKEKKLIGRIKPLYFLTEEEILLYAKLNSLPYIGCACPNSLKSTQRKFKTNIEFSRDQKLNIVYTILEVKKYLPEEKVELKFCQNCGYPTTSDTCKFCKTKERLRR
ncbi:potassium ABC transporter ATPase [Thermosipho melanesiensis]|uniref:PP-loop domain protein n=2 Tax=Thermosipho melanesiensis TaxID=46541 RepID=A6LLR6_THEM4|nr:ATP-binding protein [Thermosipho melanesiensis]ABR30867.1 PP-loop domain protein [Thermosipho melanesiensis BI429]APT73986.1 potassium ABC transporter ATPase [Thermosipho melanesiensis]OOC35917.1 potassium ABC transporter ATPase [Thermosipho melanesiensis]OOC38419.1 potassium ABC transporter ATPase [Thermosipho melanesiensis]OOC38880.1 potassium ABC transporter ATPase [Thermosipho melanesiensis]